MNSRIRAYAYLSGALFLGALMPVALGIAAGSADIYSFLFIAYLISVPPSILLVIASKRQKFFISYAKNWRDFLTIAFIGLLNYAFLEYGLLYAESHISASLATVIYRSYPLLMLLFAPLLLRERLSKHQIAALLLAFGGLFIAVSYGQQVGSYPFLPVAAAVVVALTSAIATLLVKRYTYDMQSAMLIFNLSNLAFFGALFFANGGSLAALSSSAIIAAVYVGVFYNVLTGFMYYRALRSLKTTLVTNVYFLSPFLTFIAAGLILGEPVEAYYVIVAAMVALGIFVQGFDKKGGTYVQRNRSLFRNLAIYDVTPVYSNTENEEVHNCVKGRGRALAVRVPALHAETIVRIEEAREEAARYGAIIYTDSDYAFHGKEEIEHLRSIVGAEKGDSVIVCAGRPEHGEMLLGMALPHVDEMMDAGSM